jgi:glucose/arabinose dehydrogenase/PKD repeat protein
MSHFPTIRRSAAAFLTLVLALAALVAVQAVNAPPASSAPTVRVAGLAVSEVLTGLTVPTAVRIAPNGRIFYANKQGNVYTYDNASDTTRTTTLAIPGPVHSVGDRGLIGMTLDPGFASGRPYLYVLYTYNKDPYGSATVPRWGVNGSDQCPTPPGLDTDGCTVTARLARYTVNANGVADPASARILMDAASPTRSGWCYQLPSHNIGTVEFGPDGALYVGSGEGAAFSSVDFGQYGGSLANTPTPVNPCDDGPSGRGSTPARGTSTGGALRAQSVRAATATGLMKFNGAIIRIDPDTGEPMPDNPLVGNGRAEDDRIVAYGLRNPFRFAFRPGSEQLWIGDVGWSDWEEINVARVGSGQTSVPNFGWPCYEGNGREGAYDAANLGLCESLYSTNTSSLGGVTSPLTPPRWTYSHDTPDALPAGCDNSGGASVTGGQFVTNPAWPAALRGAYVFGDYATGCIVALPLTNGEPDPSKAVTLVSGTYPSDIQRDADGNLYYLDIVTGTLHRLFATGTASQPPNAAFTATPQSGPVPLSVSFDASSSTNPDGRALTYTWDLDGDGTCDDATGVTTARTYNQAGSVTVKLCVEDTDGDTDTAVRTIVPGSDAPVITSMTSDANSLGWGVGDQITFRAAATDSDGTALPASAYTWAFDLRHCTSEAETSCHTHPNLDASGTQVTLTAPEHEYYAYLRARLTVTDGGLTTTQVLDVKPRVSTVTLRTSPAGIEVTNGLTSGASPVVQQYLYRGIVQLTVPATATVSGQTYRFSGWGDSTTTSTTRQFAAPSGSVTRTARYVLSNTNTPPVLSNLSVSPTTVRGLPANITFSVRVVDAQGVASARGVVTNPNGRNYAVQLSRVSGTARDGVWRGVVRLPSTAIAGTYRSRATGTDTNGTLRTLNGPNLSVRR